MVENMGTSSYIDKCRIDEMSKSAFIARATRLKMQQEHLDKAQLNAVKSMKCLEQHIVHEIVQMYKDTEKQRLQENLQLRQTLSLVLHSLKELKSDVGNEDKLRHLDIEHYRSKVFELEKKIRTFNEASDNRFQKLIEEEWALSNEIQMLEHKYNWSQDINTSMLKPPVRSSSKSYTSNNDNTREEVSAFQNFLRETGGHTGGWDEDDHLLFLRFRNKHKGKVTFLSSLKQQLPDISADEMLLHEDWYQKYETLKANQKQAIQEWRSVKDKNAHPSITNSEASEINYRNKVEYQEDTEEKKQKIVEWKRTLRLKKELEDKKQWEEKQKELEREQRKKERQALKKLEVERYKQEKMTQQHTKILIKQLKELRDMEERAAEANILRKAFRQVPTWRKGLT
ncbi:coiled-coil domain-containing protein 112-like isoform X2 [Periplaneta americana]|uniref:coiled-coil domain-containing protein 112-like isoform X2 n=1 Tax=Periplaneta americana TaxID=6978 RepID=UPI0037E7C2FD